MTVYFIGCDFDRVKIGFTADASPVARLATLQTGSPIPLRVLAYAPGDENDERELHKAFDRERIHGEWFVASAAITELVARVAETRSLAGWRQLLEHPALKWRPIPETGLAELRPMPSRPQTSLPPWRDLIAAWPSASDAEHITHIVHDEVGYSTTVGWRAHGSELFPTCSGKSGLVATGEALVLASGSRDREAAAWLLACLFEAAPRRISNLWYELPKRLPLFEEITSAARDVFNCEWHSASTEAFPVRFSLGERMGVSPREFVELVIQHRERVWAGHGLFAAWFSGMHARIEDSPLRGSVAA